MLEEWIDPKDDEPEIGKIVLVAIKQTGRQVVTCGKRVEVGLWSYWGERANYHTRRPYRWMYKPEFPES